MMAIEHWMTTGLLGATGTFQRAAREYAEKYAETAVAAKRERLIRERDSLVHAVQAFVDAQTESWAEFVAAAVAANCHSMPISDKSAAAVNAYQRLHATLLDMGPNNRANRPDTTREK